MSKSPNKKANSKVKQAFNEKFAYRSVIISVIFGGIFLTISIFFNIEIITVFMDKNVLFDIIDIFIKTSVILLFFFFMMISIGNYKEIVGKPISWKEFLFLIILSLGQSILNLWVFIFSVIGIIIILIYLYLIQEF
ncbi:MAG: hypothetical protein ACFE8L_00750 [Candidatus Hodarchaeota archaeon]